MNWTDDELGVVETVAGGARARLQRLIGHGQDVVWNALTDPSILAQWLAPGEIALVKGGPARLNFVDSGVVIDSVVTDIEAPRLIEYSWGGPGDPPRPLRWETAPEDGATRLTLTLTIPEGEDVARSCAGWVAHLEMLEGTLEGVSMKFPFERFKSAREAYRARLA